LIFIFIFYFCYTLHSLFSNQKHLKSQERKFQNDVQVNDEISKFKQMRLNNAQEEDAELKEIFEKSKKASLSQSQAGVVPNNKKRATNKTNAEADESDDDEEAIPIPSARTRAQRIHNDLSDQDDIGDIDDQNKKTIDDDDDDDDDDFGIDDDMLERSKNNKASRGRGRGSMTSEVKTTRGRGGARGGRGSRGGGRGAKSANSKITDSLATKSTQPSKGAKFMGTSSEIADLVELSDDEPVSTLKSTKSSNQSKMQIATTTSTRRPRINYEDDDDEDGDNYSSNSAGLAASKKSRIDNDQVQRNKRLYSENDEESESINTFSIFKRVANKKNTLK
jgi:hypothetical protein